MRGFLVVLGLFALPGLALGQPTDYSAGKTPAQLFSGDCSACHRSPRGLAKTKDVRSLASFLREHYTTKRESAGALAAYLLGNPGPPQDTRNARPGSGQAEDDVVAQDKRGRNRKPDPAELAREAARQAEAAAKQAEEVLRVKVRGYATAGEVAKPFVPPDEMPAQTAPESPSTPPSAQNSAGEPAPAPAGAEAKPAGEDRPAAAMPPG